jgi:hypothetical protein
MSLSASAANRNAALDARVARLNGGYLRVYSGTRPANPDTAGAGQTLLAEFQLGSPAFGAAVAGRATASALSAVNGAASGIATWFRLFQSDGTTAEIDGLVGTSNTDMVVNNARIVAGAQVSISTFTLTEPVS